MSLGVGLRRIQPKLHFLANRLPGMAQEFTVAPISVVDTMSLPALTIGSTDTTDTTDKSCQVRGS